MHRTNNIVLLQAAKVLSRELRKSQTGIEKFFWKIPEKIRLKNMKLTIDLLYEFIKLQGY